MEREAGAIEGNRVVATSFVVLTALAAGLGWFIGAAVIPQRAMGRDPTAYLGPVAFDITPISMAVYGAVMVGFLFVVFVGAVRAVSRYDDAKLA